MYAHISRMGLDMFCVLLDSSFFTHVEQMAHNLNFGSYRIGNAYVSSSEYVHRSRRNPNVIYDYGPFVWDRDPSDYSVSLTMSVKNTLDAKPGHVYGYRGRFYVFITNAAPEIDGITRALGVTTQRISENIRASYRSEGRMVDRHNRLIGKIKPLEESASHMGINLNVSDPANACTKSSVVTRFRGLFLLDEEVSPSGRQECVYLRTQSFAEPRPSLQIREKTLGQLRYRYNDGFVFRGDSSSRAPTDGTCGTRLTTTHGLLGNLFEDGPEYSGFVELNDLRKCIGPLMTGFLTRAIPRKAKKMASRFGVSDTDPAIETDQRIEDVYLNRVFVVYSPICNSFVIISSIVVTYTDILVDKRDSFSVPYFYSRKSKTCFLDTNIPCVVSMDMENLFENDVLRKTAESLFRSISCQDSSAHPPGDSDIPLYVLPVFHDRWRVIAMIAIMFSHESQTFGLDRTLTLWFEQEFDRLLFESLLLSTAERVGGSSYVTYHVNLRLTHTPLVGSPATFDNMLTCIDQLIREYSPPSPYRSALNVNRGDVLLPPKEQPPGLFIADDADWSDGGHSTLPSDTTTSPDVWLFVNSEIDFDAVCTGKRTQLIRLSTRTGCPSVR